MSSMVNPPAAFGGNLGMEDHLQQQVTQLLAQMILITGLDRLDRLGGLLDEVLRQRFVSLLSVPRARLPQGRHHLDQPRKLRVVPSTQGVEPAGAEDASELD